MNNGDTPSLPHLPNPVMRPGQPTPAPQPSQPHRSGDVGQRNPPSPSSQPTPPGSAPPGGWRQPTPPGSPDDWSSLPTSSPSPPPPSPTSADTHTDGGEATYASGATRRQRWKPIVAIATIVALVVIGLGVLAAMRGGRSSAANLPMNPQLQATYAASQRPERSYGHGEPIVAGKSDSLYIVSPGEGSSSVSRYANGAELWTSSVSYGVPVTVYDLDDAGPLILTGNEESLLNRKLTRLDLDTGDVVWTIDFDDGERPEVIDGRLFVVEYAEYLLFAVVEYDLATGAEINRVEDDAVAVEHDAIVTARVDEGSAQRYNINFEPVGGRIMLERAEFPSSSVIAATIKLNWVYYLDGQLIVASSQGETVALCPDSIFPVRLTATDDGIIVADGSTELQVFSFKAGVCRPVFKRDDFNRSVVDDAYAVFESYVGLTERRQYEVVELVSGDTVLTSEGQVVVAHGYAITNLDGKATLTKLDDDTDIWTIDVPLDASIQVADDLIAVVTPNGNDAIVEIYADR